MLAFRSSQETTRIDFANSFLHTLAFNAAGNALFLWCRSITTSDRIYVYDVSGRTARRHTECILSSVRHAFTFTAAVGLLTESWFKDCTENEARIIPSMSQSICILHLPNRGLLVVEAKPETPKRKLQHAEKRFMQRQIAHAATDEHLVYIDINYNIHCWSLVRNDAQGCLELEGPDKILGRSHRFSGKITLAALSKADRTIIVTICSEKGEIEAQQYTLPIENRRIAITASIGFRGKICRGLRMLCNTPMSRRCIPR